MTLSLTTQNLSIVPHRYYPTCKAAIGDLRVHLERYPTTRFGILKDTHLETPQWLLYRVHEQNQTCEPPFMIDDTSCA